MRSPSLPSDARRCPRCFLPQGCFCPLIPRLQNRTHVVVIRHALEMFKTSNTARLAALALERSSVHTYGAKDEVFDEGVLREPGTWLLFPEGEEELPSPPPARLVVVDGSWSQARRMTQKISALRGLPRFSLPGPPPGTDRIRKPPREVGMSTLEAIAYALGRLEGDALSEPLLALHVEHSRRILSLRGLVDPATGARLELE